MTQSDTITPQFVERVPEELLPGVLYISVRYRTAIHACGCGCGEEVVTPISPAHWTLVFDGETVSLSPSVGNWSTPCQSHYWIRRNRVVWAERWTPEQIARGRQHDRWVRGLYHGHGEKVETVGPAERDEQPMAKPSHWRRLRSWLRRGR